MGLVILNGWEKIDAYRYYYIGRGHIVPNRYYEDFV